jgi:hypothetical protein
MHAYTNVKVTIKNPITKEEHMTHHPVKTEITLPGIVLYMINFERIVLYMQH